MEKVGENENERVVVTDSENKLWLHSQACLDSISGVFTALIWFIGAGENNKIQSQAAPTNCR